MPDQFTKGFEVIRRSAELALHERGITGANVICRKSDGQKPTASLSIAAKGLTKSETFTYEEIEDSGEAIDAPAALKVRMLVSHFVG